MVVLNIIIISNIIIITIFFQLSYFTDGWHKSAIILIFEREKY